MSPQKINWLLFTTLVFMWGTSFLFTAIAVADFSAIQVSSLRIGLGAIILTVAVLLKGKRLPWDLKSWTAFFILGLLGNALPFFLISWGQLSISSGTTGVLMTFMPIMTILLAHFFIENERLNRYKLIGCVISFAGVALLLGPQFEGSGSLIAQLAVFTAATCYALQTIAIRLLPKFDPLVAGAGMLISASILSLPLAINSGFANIDQVSYLSLSAIIWLGIVPTGIASILFFLLVARTGPSFISNVNYVIPVVAFFTGILLLDEPLTSSNFIAVAIILAGVATTRKPVKTICKQSL